MDIIERFSNPTKFDIAPYGTIYKHGDKLFIQVSTNPEVANWLTLGDFLTECFIKDKVIDQQLIIKCLTACEPNSVADALNALKLKE